MIDDDKIARSKAIQRRTGKTFHVATRLLPERVRNPTYVLYAFFRVADEVVDDVDGTPPDEQRAELERIQRQALGEESADGAVLEAFAETRHEYGIDDEDVTVFMDAMMSDIDNSRYDTYDELETYMDGSASAVGRMMTAIMDTEDENKALPHATALGEAFQMSNFLRDVREDILERDRIYLPGTTLEKHGVTEAQIQECRMNEDFAAVMRDELARTERLYEEGVAGIKYLPKDCQLAVLLASVLYVDHHRLIRARDYDVLSTTPSLSTRRKLWLLAKTRYKWVWSKDPEAVFRDVASGFESDPSRHGPDPTEQPTIQ
jgi:phytoene synthase (EC 2.5.1.32)